MLFVEKNALDYLLMSYEKKMVVKWQEYGPT